MAPLYTRLSGASTRATGEYGTGLPRLSATRPLMDWAGAIPASRIKKTAIRPLFRIVLYYSMYTLRLGACHPVRRTPAESLSDNYRTKDGSMLRQVQHELFTMTVNCKV